jgi:hypothetical protein
MQSSVIVPSGSSEVSIFERSIFSYSVPQLRAVSTWEVSTMSHATLPLSTIAFSLPESKASICILAPDASAKGCQMASSWPSWKMPPGPA